MNPRPRIPNAEQEQEAATEVAELLKVRAERLRQKPNDGEEEATLLVAEFPVGEEQYAIPLESLRAAVPLRTVTPVPLSAPHVVGVLRFQGQLISALSLSSLLGGRGWREDPAVLLVVDPGDGQLVALDCEQIPRASALPLATVEHERSRQQGAVAPITTRELNQVNLLDLRRLLEPKTKDARHAG